MRAFLAALAAVLCLIPWGESHSAPLKDDRYFAGDRFRPDAYGEGRVLRPVRRVKGIRTARIPSKPPVQRAVASPVPRLLVTVPVAPLDAPETSPALALLAHFVSEVFAAFGRTQTVSIAVPPPARPDLFERPPLFDRPRTIADYVKTFRLKSLDGFPAPLQAKVAQLVSVCGARVTSAFRPGARVKGSGRPSLHASKRAVDLQGNPKCLYANMKGYAGGYSTDYRSVNHLHMSWGGREHGRRFAHYTGRSYRVRLASR